jgi:hypothetical protein
MTSLGHSLVGASIGLACLPAFKRMRSRLLFLVGIIAVASLPDWPLPGWGHYRLDISHSVIVNSGLILGITLAIYGLGRPTLRTYRCAAAGAAVAWLSHILMDTLYVDSAMVIFWPLSATGVSLPVPWLYTMPHVPPPFDGKILKIFWYEALTFMPFFILAAIWRKSRRQDTGCTGFRP